MNIVIRKACIDPDRMPFDAAERKGIGHPDSLADLLADAFSIGYSTWCRDRLGVVPNHWVDKVNLVGAAAEVRFGGFEVVKPADCYLFGKVTESVGTVSIPIEAIFADAIETILPAALGDKRILEHLRLHVNNTSGVATDHDPQFYRPSASAGVASVLSTERVANDTVICTGASRVGLAGRLAMKLESYVTGPDFRSAWPAVGTDVKVMVVRVGTQLDFTAAVPFHPESVASWQDYRDGLAAVEAALRSQIGRLLADDPSTTAPTSWSLHLNTKDVPGRGYLAPFGTSLGKGDCGVVGRGNRYSGVIEPLRPASCEAAAGKNPLHHVGKIYSALCADAACRIWEQTGAYAEVHIAARNGHPLQSPAHVLVSLDADVDVRMTAAVHDVLRMTLAGAVAYADRFITTDLIARFRGGDHG
ncbi:methionine adenosyltransferase [Catellatospora paridis]|uniref:methionine adenosyltransferase n=1 Tax=Catellatospora paridis TaxID=1617086 RepID=UPI0012D38945|nr:methionine adenosyltransferase [Catellatospora paridis]